MREARAWALQGDRTLTERALGHAHDLYAHGTRDADPAWLEFYVPGELTGVESLRCADLGQYEGAGVEQAVTLFATGHARKPVPDLDAATDAAHRALVHLTDVRSERLERALRDIAATLTPHRDTTAGRGRRPGRHRLGLHLGHRLLLHVDDGLHTRMLDGQLHTIPDLLGLWRVHLWTDAIAHPAVVEDAASQAGGRVTRC